MLQIVVPDWSEWDDKKEEFVTHKGTSLQLEHSLISISKWEATHRKPFLDGKPKKSYEMLDYIRCMTIGKDVDMEVYRHLTEAQVKDILEYIDTPQTATTFRETPGSGGPGKIITSEVIYYEMFANGIDKECQKWHISRLLTLIRVFGEKNQPAKKMPRQEQMVQQAKLNAARKAKLKTTG